MNDKKRLIGIIIALAIVNLSTISLTACSKVSSKETVSSSGLQEYEQSNVIEEGKQFKIVGDNTTGKYHYYIYDKNNEVVDEADIVHMAPTITYITDDIIKILIYAGTNTRACKYYDTKLNIISEGYLNPLIEKNSIVVYFHMDNDNKKLVIRDIFDKDIYYKEYNVNFGGSCAQYDDVELINGDTQVKITYRKGEDFQRVTEIFDL